MEMRFQEGTFGASICSKIKEIYYGMEKWAPEIHADVTGKFCLLKAKARKFYPESSNLDFLRQLSMYPREAIREALEDIN